MATDSFKFWDSYYDALKTLETSNQRSDFIMALCQYVFDGVDPEFSDKMVEFGFMLIRKQAELSKEIANTARENGKRGGRPAKKPTTKPTPKPRSKPTSKPTSKANRSEEKRSDSCMSRLRDSGACAPGADAPAPAPDEYVEPWDSGDYPPPPPPPSP
ncbi:DUF6291 domain-containing protein [Olsenella sp. An293]|uniref:DUF6291 domain-containing protein n=1 Tax=Olsenella sp. An293 TaxID=1965626 RepID=UPI00117E84E7|nr:DUF6291 domain-containing protein [Olsenella sp. An293]